MKNTPSPMFCIVCLTIGILATSTGAHAQLYTGTNPTTGLWSSARWSALTNGPFTSAWVGATNSVFLTGNSYTFTGIGSINIGDVTVQSNATVTLSGTSGNVTIGAVRTIEVQTNALLDFNLQGISGTTTNSATGFIKTGDGVFATGSGTNQGGFTLNGGTVVARGTTGLGGGPTNVLTLSNGVLAANNTRNFDNTRFGGGINIRGNIQFGALSNNYATNAQSLISDAASLTFSNNTSLGASTRTLTIGGNGNYTFLAPISGDSAGVGLTITNASGATGKFVLSGTNTFTGTTTIAGGRVDISAPAGSGTFLSTNIVISGGTLSFTFAGAQNIITNTAALSISSGGFNPADRNQTLAMLNMSGGFINKSGFGVLAFSGASTNSGGTIIASGTNSDIRFSGGLALGGATAASLVYSNAANNSATPAVRLTTSLTYSSNNAAAASFSNALAGVGMLQLAGTSVSFDVGDAAGVDSEVTIDWNVTGANIGLTKQSGGVLTLQRSNSFGSVAINGGTLRLGDNGALSTNTVTISNATIASSSSAARSFSNALVLAGNATFGDATGTGDLSFTNTSSSDLGGATRTLTTAVNTTINAALANGGVIKAGSRTLTFGGSAANTYAGTTVVTNGVLQLDKTAGVNAISGSSVSVASAASLLISANNQVIDTATITLSGGTIARGGSGVSETFGDLNLTADSFLNYGAGAAGTFTFGAYTPTFKLTVANFLAGVGNTLRFTNDLSSDINNTSLFAFDSAFTYDWNTTTPGFFTITAIPEPSTVLAALGLTGLMLWPARRRLGPLLGRN